MLINKNVICNFLKALHHDCEVIVEFRFGYDLYPLSKQVGVASFE